MKTRYRLIRRGHRGSRFYGVDTQTGRRFSLGTANEEEASQIVLAKNQALRQPELNLRIAQAYLAGADPHMTKRTWAELMAEYARTKSEKNRLRYERAIKEKAFDLIRGRPLIDTRPEHFLRVLQAGTVSTNNYLRRFHNFALNLSWLPWPVLPKAQWPAMHYREKRAITREEHERILRREPNAELRAFYECCWHLGGAQSDVAKLRAEDVDWQGEVLSFFRSKTGAAQIVHFGEALKAILQGLPSCGPLFPSLEKMDEKHRACRFQRICRCLQITGISLHSYRYAWAERARTCTWRIRSAES
jgi:integrase